MLHTRFSHQATGGIAQLLFVVLAVFLLVLISPAAPNPIGRTARAADFQGLGDLPGGSFNSQALDVSANGSVVVGYGVSGPDYEAFRWTASGGMFGLGDLPDGSFSSRAYGVSADGLVVVGGGVSELGPEAFRWTPSGDMVGPGRPAGWIRL